MNPFFSVLRQPLSTDFEGEEITVGRDVLLNGEIGNVLGTVGEIYKLVTNEEVDRIFADAFSDLPIEQTFDHMNYKENRWQRDFILNGDTFNIMVGDDVVKTKVSIWNGYDGKSSVGFSISAYNDINGVALLSRKMFGKTYSHVQSGLVDRIREDFASNLVKFQRMATLFNQWNNETFTFGNFEEFIRSRINNDNNDGGFLNERQAESIIESYEPHMYRLNRNRTRWAAYNVLSSIASQDISARGQSSNIFTAGYKRMERLAADFFELDGEDLFTI